MHSSDRSLTVAFVLVSYAIDAPAGMERATAALAQGLRQLGHHALIITAIKGADRVRLTTLNVIFPCDDPELRHAISSRRQDIADELCELYREHEVDVGPFLGQSHYCPKRITLQRRVESTPMPTARR